MENGSITEIDIHSWNKYVDAQQAKHPERALRWEMERITEDRRVELERHVEARTIVETRSQGTI